MARMPDDVLVPFGLATPGLPLGDDEIAVHVEALEDGRDTPGNVTWRPVELQDDEIGSHLEQSEMVFALPSRRARPRRPTRH